jgi:choline dehydrogenase
MRSRVWRWSTSARAVWRLAAEVPRYLFTGKGILTYSASLDAASVKGAGEIGDPRRAVQHRSRSFKDGRIGELDDSPGVTVGAWQMRLLSRGYIEARLPNPGEAPARPDRPAGDRRRAAILRD